jgi:4-carboxymuconolactone decarboxylase
MDPSYTDRLRQLAMATRELEETGYGDSFDGKHELDSKSLALVRIAGLVAIGGAVPSFGAEAEAAVAAGASPEEIVDVLVGLIPVLGLPCVVTAAPRLALALGCDIEEGL